ncbi:hypothetical protein DAI22_12g130300 [Oryza sativa Japonica Group]|nr:hypothetical protein DAI22_12g130300 [Oryza sativa Japonica Group]
MPNPRLKQAHKQVKQRRRRHASHAQTCALAMRRRPSHPRGSRPAPDATANAAARAALPRRPTRPWTPPPALFFLGARCGSGRRHPRPTRPWTFPGARRRSGRRRSRRSSTTPLHPLFALSCPVVPKAHELARAYKRAEPSLISSSLGSQTESSRASSTSTPMYDVFHPS